MLVLGIETSCDETAMAIVDENKNILSHVVVSQIDIFKDFGGVIPEVASRNHLDVIDKVLEKVFSDAKLDYNDIDAVSATTGPGLIGGVIVGTVFAKSIASILKKPFIAVNHLEAHALTSRISNNLDFPFLLFLLSGGHCQILKVLGVGKYKKISETIDDALGECFDKVAQMIGLEYPGGPKIEELAKNGDENRFKFSKPLIDNTGKKRDEKSKFLFSFSGLKTCVRTEIEKLNTELTEKDKCDISASFQKTIVDILKNRLENVFKKLEEENINLNNLVIAGGVSANQYIKSELTEFCKKYNYNVITPPLKLCTDNGVMVAWAGLERFKLGLVSKLDVCPKARWELEE